MARNIAVSDEAYELLLKARLPGESFSDIIKRSLKREMRLMDIFGSGTLSRKDWLEAKKVLERSQMVALRAPRLASMSLFDTTFLIDLVNGDPGAEKLAQRVDAEKAFISFSVISAHEYLFGIHFRYGGAKEALQERLLRAERELARFEILPLSLETVKISSEIQAYLERRGETIGSNDIFIAATAIQYRLTLATRDSTHFSRIPELRTESY